MKTKNRLKKGIALGMSMVLLMGAVTGCGSDKGKDKEESDTVTITNVSYDPTRELYEQYNKIFKDYYKEKTGKNREGV